MFEVTFEEKSNLFLHAASVYQPFILKPSRGAFQSIAVVPPGISVFLEPASP